MHVLSDQVAAVFADVEPVEVTDVGAQYVGTQPSSYQPLVAVGKARVLGFEPLQAECDVLNSSAHPGDRYLPYALGDGGPATLYCNNYATTTSLYRPDLSAMDRYQNLSEYCQVESEIAIETVRLDDIPEARSTEFLKIDVQGCELTVLQHSTAVLAHTLAVQTEVEFYPIYEGQPTFAQVDALLHSQGFMFHHFRDMDGRALKAAPQAWDQPGNCRQQLWSDAVYIRDFRTWCTLGSTELMKLALIMFVCYRADDFTATLLKEITLRDGRSFDLKMLFA